MARAGIEGVRRHRAPVAVAAETERGDSLRHLGVVVDVGDTGRGKVALVGEVRTLLVLDPRHQLGEQEVDVGIALPVRVRRQVHRHVVYRGEEVGAVIEIEAAQEILVRLAVAAVLRDDHSGNVLEHFARPQHRPRLDQLRGDGALARGVRGADRVFVVSDDADLRSCLVLLCGTVLHAKRGKKSQRDFRLLQDRSHRTQSESYRAPYSVVEPSLPW